uniref:Uncharacterized protein AlNc14C205G8782 n=1 Tax=Albugo laibachii Nc14 TaxID=890382 RepID=F0WQX2_9STRA|nr:PREDICTED: hypothetical protein [Albugo laibachii Nc14]|eukprot:CCA23732.1 PREDICTED: hypothetical protein [Albugo laibachii Nc14]
MDPSTAKVILALAKRWNVPARHVYKLYAYVKADKEKQVGIYLRIAQGMFITQEDIRKLGETRKTDMELHLKKSLYGLNQAGRLWIQLLDTEMEKNGFDWCTTDMGLYHKRVGGKMVIFVVYVDDLLVTATKALLVKEFLSTMGTLSVKDFGDVRKFLGMLIELDDTVGYTIDQQVAIEDLLVQRGIAEAKRVPSPVGVERNNVDPEKSQ